MLDPREAQRLLDDFLAAKNVSRSEWDSRMEQKAYLRKIAEAEVAKTTITDDMLRNEYEQDYGEKVQIRHIQVGSLAAAARVRALLAANKDFELVARQMSENQLTSAQGGLARPFTRNDPGVTPLLREAAFKLKTGEISEAIRDGNVYHIIRVERRFPASDVGFDNADRDELRRKLHRPAGPATGTGPRGGAVPVGRGRHPQRGACPAVPGEASQGCALRVQGSGFRVQWTERALDS